MTNSTLLRTLIGVRFRGNFARAPFAERAALIRDFFDTVAAGGTADELPCKCGGTLIYMEPAPPDPECGIFKPWRGGYSCDTCSHRAENDERGDDYEPREKVKTTAKRMPADFDWRRAHAGAARAELETRAALSPVVIGQGDFAHNGDGRLIGGRP